MVWVELNGGLGNQLFQIACGYAVSKECGKPLRISRAPVCGKRPAYWSSWTHALAAHVDATHPSADSLSTEWHYVEPCMHYVPVPHDKTVLRGYF